MTITVEDELSKLLEARSSALGVSVDELVNGVLEERFGALVRPRVAKPIDWAGIRALQDRVAALPTLDTRSDDEILGYNEHGHFDSW